MMCITARAVSPACNQTRLGFPLSCKSILRFSDKNLIDFGISFSYNYVGKRIIIVGNTDEPSIWENPRHILDLQLSKTFKNKFEVKLNLRDALAQNLIYYQDINKNGKFDKASLTDNKEFSHLSTSDNVMVNTKLAPTISLSLSYKFK